MIRYAAGRLFQGLAVIFAVTTLTFLLIQSAPGEPMSAWAESSRALTPEVREQARRNWGLDRPIPIQYLRYLENLAGGDLGISPARNRPVLDVLRERIPNTLLLATAALLVDFIAGITIALFQATHPSGRLDRWLSTATLTLYSVPVFLLGIVLFGVFGRVLHWFPIGGMRDPVLYDSLSGFGRTLDILHHLTLPALTLGLVGAASTARYQRAALLQTLGQGFMRTARAKGLTRQAVLVGHALRNALLPTITLLGVSLPLLLSGAVLVETVFAWPGMGALSTEAITQRDYPVVTAAAILSAIMVVLGSGLADLLYRFADPRIRESP